VTFALGQLDSKGNKKMSMKRKLPALSLLSQEDEVHLSEKNNDAIFWAAENGRTGLVRLLLADERRSF
jgi:hypothetical protein